MLARANRSNHDGGRGPGRGVSPSLGLFTKSIPSLYRSLHNSYVILYIGSQMVEVCAQMVEPPSQLVEVTPLNWWSPPLNWWTPLSIGGGSADDIMPPCHPLPPRTRNRSPLNSRAPPNPRPLRGRGHHRSWVRSAVAPLPASPSLPTQSEGLEPGLR